MRAPIAISCGRILRKSTTGRLVREARVIYLAPKLSAKYLMIKSSYHYNYFTLFMLILVWSD